uniref:Uncharacterized protein n=1 Tax=Lactuca sativa TaxID=4236 RepID=A0A9R1WSP6_LACSA|nr:hypothetical protein LSAT_V11C900482440 [Lactuca sativa]
MYVLWGISTCPTKIIPPKYHVPIGRPRKRTSTIEDDGVSVKWKSVTCTKYGNDKVQHGIQHEKVQKVAIHELTRVQEQIQLEEIDGTRGETKEMIVEEKREAMFCKLIWCNNIKKRHKPCTDEIAPTCKAHMELKHDHYCLLPLFYCKSLLCLEMAKKIRTRWVPETLTRDDRSQIVQIDKLTRLEKENKSFKQSNFKNC